MQWAYMSLLLGEGAERSEADEGKTAVYVGPLTLPEAFPSSAPVCALGHLPPGGRLAGGHMGPPLRIPSRFGGGGKPPPYKVFTTEAFALPSQAQPWNCNRRNFPSGQGPVARKKTQAITPDFARRNHGSTNQEGAPRKKGSGESGPMDLGGA